MKANVNARRQFPGAVGYTMKEPPQFNSNPILNKFTFSKKEKDNIKKEAKKYRLLEIFLLFICIVGIIGGILISKSGFSTDTKTAMTTTIGILGILLSIISITIPFIPVLFIRKSPEKALSFAYAIFGKKAIVYAEKQITEETKKEMAKIQKSNRATKKKYRPKKS